MDGLTAAMDALALRVSTTEQSLAYIAATLPAASKLQDQDEEQEHEVASN
jgi:hypothetical protein